MSFFIFNQKIFGGSNTCIYDAVKGNLTPFYQAGVGFAEKWRFTRGGEQRVIIDRTGVGASIFNFGDSSGSASPTGVSGAGGHTFTIMFGVNMR